MNLSPDQWTNIILAFGAGSSGIIGYFLLRLVRQFDQEAGTLRSRVSQLEKDHAVVQTVLEQNGLLAPRERTIPIQQRGA